MKNKIIENYRDNELLRNEFHHFMSKVFPSLNFKEWYSKGFWTENYVPFSIMENEKIISNACVAMMNIILNRKKYKAVQIGAVGTLPEYRNRGLSRELMKHIINKYQNEVDFFFLHANKTVMAFYPKFGFKGIKESVFVQDSNIPEARYSARKLNIDDDKDFTILQNLINNRQTLSKTFGAEDYGFITMWHILNLYRNSLYFIEEENAIIIKQEEEGIMYVMDVIFSQPFNFREALPKVIESDSLKWIKYYFTGDQLHYDYDEAVETETGLFVLGEADMGHTPFRFPETAVT